MNMTSLEFDRLHLWHPYTSMTDPLPVYEVASAHGVRLRLADGRQVIDGMSSWWAAIHGYNHPVLNEAARQQLDKMAHVMFGGITHNPAITLARTLIDVTPAPLERIFLCDSGSVSVEVSIKMAMQYWQAQGNKNKTRLLTVRGGYHGDTFGAMGVCDPVTGMHSLFHTLLPKHFFAPLISCGFYDQWNDTCLDPFRQLLQKNHQEIAAVILEPVVQGAGGMRFYHPRFLSEARKLCDHYQVLLIVDEIATGFGRTGELFGCHHAQISPDIMCLGKALTGGYMTLAATLTTAKVAEVISSGDPGLLMHGPTFMGNPLACAVAQASLTLLTSSPWQHKVKNIETRLKAGLQSCRQHHAVQDVRVLGAIGVVEMKKEVDVATIQQQCIDRGVWIRPFGRLIYMMPPYIISADDLHHLCSAVTDVVKNIG